MTRRWRALSRVLAVLAGTVLFVMAAAWPGYQELRRIHPVQHVSIAMNEPTTWEGAVVTIRPAAGDHTEPDQYGVDDRTQQVFAVDMTLDVQRPMPEVASCTAQLVVTVDQVPARHQIRTSASQVACDGNTRGVQESRFVFVIPRGTIDDASLFVQVGSESGTWLAVPVG